MDYDSTMIGALELSAAKFVFAVQLPGVKKNTRHVLEANVAALVELIERLKARPASRGLCAAIPHALALGAAGAGQREFARLDHENQNQGQTFFRRRHKGQKPASRADVPSEESAKRILQKLLFGFRTWASQRFVSVRETTKPDNLIPMAQGVLKG